MAHTLVFLIVCHIIGDFLLQNHWMQRKNVDSFVCSVHVLCYLVPFFVAVMIGVLPHGWLITAIVVEHYAQDRYSLHLRWMKLIAQTTPDKWPAGPLFVDQAWHITSMAVLTIIFYC